MTTITWISSVGDWLGATATSEFDLASLAENRLSTNVVTVMMGLGLTTKEVHLLVIPQRTLKHRKSRRESLSRDESDRAIRAARVLASAQVTFGSPGKALLWMREPKQRFDGRPPIEMLSTEAGGRLVEEMLVQIDEGMFG